MKTKILINVIEEVRDPATNEIITKSTYEYHAKSHFDAMKAFRHLATRMASFSDPLSSSLDAKASKEELSASDKIIKNMSDVIKTGKSLNDVLIERIKGIESVKFEKSEELDDDEIDGCEFMKIMGNHWCSLTDDTRNPIYCVYNENDYTKCKIREKYLKEQENENA